MEDKDIRDSGEESVACDIVDVAHDKMEGLATGTFIFVQLDGDEERRFARMWDAIREQSLWYVLHEDGLTGLNDLDAIATLEATYRKEAQNAAERIQQWADEEDVDIEELGLLRKRGYSQ